MTLTKEQQLILLGIITSIIIGLGVTTYKHNFDKPSNVMTIDKPVVNALMPRTTITIHLTGAVAREGVYQLKAGDRLLAAIDLAGGALPRADLSAVNLAEVVKDGSKTDLPFKRTAQQSEPNDNQAKGKIEKPSQVININNASEQALDSLPGVGPSTAKAIVEYRKTKGLFTQLKQIMEIPRFGKSKFEKIKDRIVI